MFKVGSQCGVIVYGGGINARAYAQIAITQGKVVIWRDNYATIHNAR